MQILDHTPFSTEILFVSGRITIHGPHTASENSKITSMYLVSTTVWFKEVKPKMLPWFKKTFIPSPPHLSFYFKISPAFLFLETLYPLTQMCLKTMSTLGVVDMPLIALAFTFQHLEGRDREISASLRAPDLYIEFYILKLAKASVIAEKLPKNKNGQQNKIPMFM